MKIGEAIKLVRKEKNVSQNKLSKMLDVTLTTICNIEQGRTALKKDFLSKIALALCVNESYILIHSIRKEDVLDSDLGAFESNIKNLKKILKRSKLNGEN